MPRICIPIFLLLVACPPLPAQPSAATPDGKTEICVVALGAKPARKYRQVEEGGSRILLRSDPGQIPPSRLYYRGKTKGGAKEGWLPFRLPFNTPPIMREVAAGKPLALYRNLSKDGGYKKYVTIPAAPAGARRVYFLLASGKGAKPWNAPPKVRSIALDAGSFSDKYFILKNLSRHDVLHAFDQSVVSVAPMKTISYKNPKTGQLYRLAARYGSKKKIIYNTAVRFRREGDIQLFALYDANPRTNFGRSVGVFRTIIPAPKNPSPVCLLGGAPIYLRCHADSLPLPKSLPAFPPQWVTVPFLHPTFHLPATS